MRILRAGLRDLWSALVNPRLFGPFRLRIEPNSITVATSVVGLGNRLVAIASARGLAREYSKSMVNLIWIADNDIAYCRFSDLFELTTDDTRVVVDRNIGISLLLLYFGKYRGILYLYKHRGRLFVYGVFSLLRWMGYLLTRVHFDKIFHTLDMAFVEKKEHPWEIAARFRRLKPKLGNRTLVYSHELFHEKPQFDFCRPRPHIQTRVDEIADRFGEYTVGVHIRLEDSVGRLIELSSPVELFIQKMTAEVEKDDRVKFFLATDSSYAKQIVMEHFKDRVVIQEGSLIRTEHSGMENAVVDLFTLARTDKILAPYLSTFSRCAAMIGETEFEVILNNSILNQVYKEDLAPALRMFEDGRWC